MKKGILLFAVLIACWFTFCNVAIAEDTVPAEATPSDFQWALEGGLNLTYITPWLPLPEDITPGIYPATKLTLADYKQGLVTGGLQAAWTKALKDGRILPDVWGAGVDINVTRVLSQIPNMTWVGDFEVSVGGGLLFKEVELKKPMFNLSLQLIKLF